MARPNNGPYLDTKKDGTFEIRWSDDGRSKRRSTGTKNLPQAQKILANFILMLLDEETKADPAHDVMVLEVLGDPDAPDGEDYWHEHVIPNVIGKDSARFTFAKLKPHFGHMAVKDIMPVHIDAYVAARKAGRIGRPSVGHTISRELSILNAAINHAYKARRLSMADKPFIKKPPHSPPRDRWLSQDEATILLKAARGDTKELPRIYRFMVLALNTAARRGALLELTTDQVDMERGIIYLNPAGRAQTKKRRAIVPISDELRPILAQTLNQIDGKYILDHPGAIKTAFATACRNAGLKGVTPHTFRHTWGTWAAQRGVSFYDMSGVMGDTIATIERTYAHHCPDHLRSAVNAVRDIPVEDNVRKIG
jgi:integrase